MGDMKTIVFDIEANQLEINKDLVIFCIATYCIETQEWKIFEGNEILNGVEYLKSATRLVGHNIIGYDLPALGIDYNRSISDTFICSQMLFTNERSQHSLDSWGVELGYPKVKYSNWGKYTSELKERCIVDVKITYQLYKKCVELLKGHPWKKSIELEHKVYQIYSQHGTKWRIDLPRLDIMLTQLTEEYEELFKYLKKLGRQKPTRSEEIFKPFLKNGTISSRARKLFGTNISGECCLIEFEEFNPGSTVQMTQCLINLGWKPTNFTDKGSPSFRDDPLLGIQEDIRVKLSRFRDIKHQIGVLEGIKDKTDPTTGAIKMFAKTCGTNTARFTHQLVANIQKEFKPLFIARDGYKLIGCDASALEARVEGHFTSLYDGGLYKTYLLETDDIHTLNANLWGVSRQVAKNCFYALSYGAGPGKLSKMMGTDLNAAKELIKTHYETWPGLTKFIKSLEHYVSSMGFTKLNKWGKSDLDLTKKPYIIGIDQRKLFVREIHSLKNTMIQSTGSIAMKIAYCNIFDFICQHKLDAKIVMFYHDEFVIEVINNDDQIKLLQKGVEDAIVKAGESLKLSVPLIGESKVGNNWEEIK